jgi:hypothetical protein
MNWRGNHTWSFRHCHYSLVSIVATRWIWMMYVQSEEEELGMLLPFRQRCLQNLCSDLFTLFIRPSEESTSQTRVMCQHSSPSSLTIFPFADCRKRLDMLPYMVIVLISLTCLFDGHCNVSRSANDFYVGDTVVPYGDKPEWTSNMRHMKAIDEDGGSSRTYTCREVSDINPEAKPQVHLPIKNPHGCSKFRICGICLGCSVNAVQIVGCASGKLWREDVRSRGGGLDDRDLGTQPS